jgi:integrase
MRDAEVAAYIGRWRPVSVPPQAAGLARLVVERAAPGCRKRANALLWSAARLADFAASLGLEMAPEVVFHPSVIERFALVAPGLTDSARRTLRTNQRFIARRVVPALHPPDAALPRERAKQPYSPAEIGGYLALADAQPTKARRARAAGLVCLGAGAGLIRGDLRQIRGTDVIARSGGVIVAVRGARPRAVPVLGRYHEPLLAAAAFAGSGLVTGGTQTGRKNVTARLSSSLAGGAGLPRLEGSRLRATWLREAADLVAGLEPAGEAEAVRLLGAVQR